MFCEFMRIMDRLPAPGVSRRRLDGERGAALEHARTRALRSGGMKRKLSLGIAFLGGSRLVVPRSPRARLAPMAPQSPRLAI